MQKKHLLFLFFFGSLMVSCDSFVNEQETLTHRELPDTGTFTAIVNGENWIGHPRGTNIIYNESDTLLSISANQVDSLSNWYYYNIGFTVLYSKNKTEYSIKRESINNNQLRTGARVSESHADISISSYYNLESPDDYFRVQIVYDSLGVRRATGTFALTVVIDPKYLTQTLRRQADTLYIKNGKFDVIMEDDYIYGE
jgi:hypothetical protein